MRFSRSFHTRRPSQGTVRFVACRGSVADPPEEFSVSALEERFSSAKLARRKVAKIRIATGLIILILMIAIINSSRHRFRMAHMTNKIPPCSHFVRRIPEERRRSTGSP